MRAALLTGTLLVAFAMPAVAQAPGGQQGNQSNSGYQNDQDDYGPPGTMWRGGGQHHWGDRGDWQGGGSSWADMERRLGAERFGGIGAGTFYRFQRGDDMVAVRCAPREPVQQCVQGAIELMKALPPSTGSAASTGQTQH